MPEKKTLDEFITAATKVHGTTYDYSLVEYINSYTKVRILCAEHGEFLQKPSMHLRGQGCKKCGTDSTRKSKEEFVEEANSVHNRKYDYSLANYVDAKTHLDIICKEHGVFAQSPNHHIRGRGCPVCSGVSKSNTEDFVEKAQKIHGAEYDYTLTIYAGALIPVKIICKEHGTFEQSPSNHLRGRGCPSCSEKGFDPSIPAHLYLIQCESLTGTFTGYGITKNLEQRMRLHGKNLHDQAFTITKQQVYHFPLGSYAKELEDMLYAEYPDPSNIGSSVPGFKRESTDTPFAQVKEFIEQKIKENSLRWGLLE